MPVARDHDRRVPQAVTYIVSGGGGGPLYPIGRDAWTATAALEHHYVKVTINGCIGCIDGD